jgi:hypothetical protein
MRGKVSLTRDHLARHFRACWPEHVIGLHSTSPINTSLWGAVDVDWHGPTSTAPAINLAAALAWHDRLRQLGFLPLLTDSNGSGGYHVRVLFREPLATSRVFAFLQWLVRDHAALGHPVRPETFPKQQAIDEGRYGNWLRVPGRHHTAEHWSRVWDGAAWIDGEAAVALILGLTGDSPALIPVEVAAAQRRLTMRRAVRVAPTCPSGSVQKEKVSDDRLADIIQARMAKLPAGLGEGQHRDDYGYQFACFLVRDLSLSDAEALPWLREWDRTNAVSKGEDRLHELLASAHAYGQSAYGCGLQRTFRQHRKPARHALRRIRVTVEA